MFIFSILGYGLTEACGVGLATPISDWKSGSVGVPIPGMEVKVSVLSSGCEEFKTI